MFAELEGILLDQVYSAKGAAALFGYDAAFDFSGRCVTAVSAA